MQDERFTVRLGGCSPQPLGAYLKALGLFRITAEQYDRSAEGYWSGNDFFIRSRLNEAELVRFFAEDYRPTPIMAPWNGGSGFYPKDNKAALDWIRKSRGDRLAPYREAISVADRIMAAWASKPSKDEKEDLLQACRANLPDQTVDWLDAAFVLGTDAPKYPPLLGTGGNDGRLEFTNNFMQRLMDVIDPDGRPAVASTAWLASSLFGEVRPGLLRGQPIGQFNPAGAGGANSASGFEGDSLVNPWDFILMIEGSLLFASGVVRRGETNLSGELSYPFSVNPSGVGYGTASKEDERTARAELWVPLWSVPARYEELRSLFSEGRSNVERRKARDGTDFARAIATLGVDRGIDSFQRFGFMERNGRAYFAVPLGRYMVRRNPQADLLASIDGWLTYFRQKASEKNGVPSSIRRALGDLDRAILQLCTEESPRSVQSMFIALGRCERALNTSSKWTKEKRIAPIPPLRPDWFAKGYDGSSEYRIAASIALISGSFVRDGAAIRAPIRSMVEPITFIRRAQGTSVSWAQEERAPILEGRADGLFNELMNRRIKEHLKEGAKEYSDRSPVTASLRDVNAFLRGGLDEELMVELFWGLVLLDPFATYRQEESDASEDEYSGSAFALLKLCHAPDPMGAMRNKDPQDERDDRTCVPLVPEIQRKAASGNMNAATQLAIRRLRGSGRAPKVKDISLSAEQSMRVAAALLIPLDLKSIRILEKRTLEEIE